MIEKWIPQIATNIRCGNWSFRSNESGECCVAQWREQRNSSTWKAIQRPIQVYFVPQANPSGVWLLQFEDEARNPLTVIAAVGVLEQVAKYTSECQLSTAFAERGIVARLPEKLTDFRHIATPLQLLLNPDCEFRLDFAGPSAKPGSANMKWIDRLIFRGMETDPTWIDLVFAWRAVNDRLSFCRHVTFASMLYHELGFVGRLTAYASPLLMIGNRGKSQLLYRFVVHALR